MAEIFPFRGYLPRKDLTRNVVSKPFDKYLSKDVESILKGNPNSFLHVIKPDLAKGIKSPSDAGEQLVKSRNKFLDFTRQGVFQKSDKPCFYLYRQTKSGIAFTGVIATIAASDYRNGKIKIHEQTLSHREEKLKDYLKVVGINAEPVLFTYPHADNIDGLIEKMTLAVPYADFEMENVRHQLWCIEQDEDIEQICKAFKSLEYVYVADGHHRSASSVLLADELSAKTGASNQDKPWSHFLGIFFPDNNLKLYEFNRLLKDLNGLQTNDILDKLKDCFEIELVEVDSYKPQNIHSFSMYLDGKWYALHMRVAAEDLKDKLDADLLNEYILKPVFGISDLRKDPRIEFVSGVEGPLEMKRRVDSGRNAIAFGLFPVSFDQFFQFSNEGKIMPPKTTWFEPKLLNALVVYDLEIHSA